MDEAHTTFHFNFTTNLTQVWSTYRLYEQSQSNQKLAT